MYSKQVDQIVSSVQMHAVHQKLVKQYCLLQLTSLHADAASSASPLNSSCRTRLKFQVLGNTRSTISFFENSVRKTSSEAHKRRYQCPNIRPIDCPQYNFQSILFPYFEHHQDNCLQCRILPCLVVSTKHSWSVASKHTWFQQFPTQDIKLSMLFFHNMQLVIYTARFTISQDIPL